MQGFVNKIRDLMLLYLLTLVYCAFQRCSSFFVVVDIYTIGAAELNVNAHEYNSTK